MCMKQKQIEALKDLCLKAGINDADIAACAPQCEWRLDVFSAIYTGRRTEIVLDMASFLVSLLSVRLGAFHALLVASSR